MTFAISIVLKGTLVCCLVLAVLLVLKKSSAAVRHWIISLSMASLLCLPIFQYFTPTFEVELPVSEQFVALESTISSLPIIVPPSSPVQEEITRQQDNFAPISLTAPTPTPSTFALPFAMQWSQLLIGVWLLGFGFFFLKMLLGILAISQITKHAESFALRSEHQNLLALRRKVQYLVSDEIKTPMTWGIFSPKILLPATHSTWTSEEMRVVLLHELSHIKRHDYAWHLLGIATLSLYWLHPLVWILQRWQQSEREKACDEYVLSVGVSKTDYAQQLVKVARQLMQAKPVRWSASLPMAQSSQTKKRVFAILRFDAAAWQFTPWLQWRWMGIFACCLPLLAAVHPASRTMIEESIPQVEAALEQSIFDVTTNTSTSVLVENTNSATPIISPKIEKKNIGVSPKLTSNIPSLEAPVSEIVVKQKMAYDTASKAVAKPAPLGYYGQWGGGNQPTVQVWTRGTFDVQHEAPYFVNLSENALVIVHINRDWKAGDKGETLVVGQAKEAGWIKTDVKGNKKKAVETGEVIYTRLKKSKPLATSTYEPKKGFEEAALWDDWIKQFSKASYMMQSFDNSAIWQAIQVTQSQKTPLWHTMITAYETGFMHQVEPLDRKVKYKGNPVAKVLKSNNEAVKKIEMPDFFLYVPSGLLYTQEKQLSVAGFYMHHTEVTNKSYREFLEDMQSYGKPYNWDDIRIHDENWKVAGSEADALAKQYHQHPAYDNYPVVNVSYEGAIAYCKWLETKMQAIRTDGKTVQVRLPTREEWMHAARGGHTQVPFPWGGYYLRNAKGCYLANFSPVDESQLRYDAKTDKYEVMGKEGNSKGECFNKTMVRVLDDGGQFTVRSDAYFPNDYGLYNMSGNVAEMLQEKGTTKGGSWNSAGYYIQIEADDEHAGWSEPSPFIGFRPLLVIR